jgi:hypothetical protein
MSKHTFPISLMRVPLCYGVITDDYLLDDLECVREDVLVCLHPKFARKVYSAKEAPTTCTLACIKFLGYAPPSGYCSTILPQHMTII